MYTAIASNKRRTLLLLAGFVAFLATLGYVIGLVSHRPGLFYVIGIGALIYSAISYWFSAKITLAMSGAKEVSKREAPEFYRTVENLSIATGLPMPKVYIIQDSSPNAFATGRDPKHAAVAATTGLLAILDKNELEGVMAHEMAHVGNYDIRLMAVVAALVSVVAIISDFFVNMTIWGGDDEDNGAGIWGLVAALAIAIIAPLIATLVQLAISRRREYLADATAALTTRYPEGLASALRKIDSSNQPMHRSTTATAHLYIANPLKKGGLMRLLSTHPPMEDRIARLAAMEDKA